MKINTLTKFFYNNIFQSLCLLTICTTSFAALPAKIGDQPLPSLAPILEGTLPTIVNIHTKTRVQVNSPFSNDPFFRYFFNLPNVPRERISQSLGSGVIVDAEKGYVLTNNHVIEGADEIAVTLHNNNTLSGEVIGTDPATDLAVIKIPAENLTAITLADSSQLKVGDFVVAVGNPFGLGQTVTSGIVSALGRSGLYGLGGYQQFIQTDASINPGNSGGALINLRGELVGINNAIFSPSGGNVGIGFAIPINLAMTVMEQLVETGIVRRGVFTINFQDITSELAKALKIKAIDGVIITDVVADSAVEKAGLKIGDIITMVDNEPIASSDDLLNILGVHPAGKPFKLIIDREGKKITATTALTTEPIVKVNGDELNKKLSGAILESIVTKSKRYGAIEVIEVTEVKRGSTAWKYGLRKGDVITAINRQEIGTLQNLYQMLTPEVKQFFFSIVRNNEAFYIAFQ